MQSIESHLLAARPGQILLCHDGGGDRSQTYSALSVSLAMVGTWLVFGLLQGVVAGFVFEQLNP